MSSLKLVNLDNIIENINLSLKFLKLKINDNNDLTYKFLL